MGTVITYSIQRFCIPFKRTRTVPCLCNNNKRHGTLAIIPLEWNFADFWI